MATIPATPEIRSEQGFPPAPATPLDAAGNLRAGAYLDEVGGLEALASPSAGRALLRVRLKRWIDVCVFSPRWILSFAIADVGYLGNVFAYAFDRARGGMLVEVAWITPLALETHVSRGLQGVLADARSGARWMEIRGDGRGLRVVARLGAIEAELRVPSIGAPITVLSQLGRCAPGATVKAAGFGVEGCVTVSGERVDLGDARGTGDATCAVFPYRTRWNWATGAGLDRSGRAVGINLATGVHEDREGRFSENALWLCGEPRPLPLVRFRVGLGGAPWVVRSSDGRVDLEFRPLGERAQNVNLWLIASRFRQVFGTFEGRMTDLSGRSVELDHFPGAVEDHEARW